MIIKTRDKELENNMGPRRAEPSNSHREKKDFSTHRKISARSRPPVSAEDGFIVILDALGTQGIWAVDNPQHVLNRRLRLKDFINASFVNFKVTTSLGKDSKTTSRKMGDVRLHVQFLSDTVIVSIVPSSNVDKMVLLADIASLVGPLFTEAIRDGVLYRGAISAGKFYSSEDILIGPAVDEAADWAYRGDWAGIMLTPSAHRIVRETVANHKQHVFGLVHWDVPVKSASGQSSILPGSFVVAWPLWAQRIRSELDSLFLRPPVPLDVEIKHRNTIRFYRAVRGGEVSVKHKFIPRGSTTIKPSTPKMPEGWWRRRPNPSRRPD